MQIMANLDVGVDAKLWLKFVTHNKSVSGYFTSHGTKQRIIRASDSGPRWMTANCLQHNTWINKYVFCIDCVLLGVRVTCILVSRDQTLLGPHPAQHNHRRARDPGNNKTIMADYNLIMF